MELNKVWRESASDLANALTTKTIEEFLEFAKVPRPGFYNVKALEYFQAWADKHGFKHYRDDYGNFWMDVPATAGCEDFPKVILQAHMDMVCVAVPGLDIDFKTTGIKPVINGNKMTAEGTSLGADNGIGVAAALAIVDSDIPHGPIRCLFTSDEDVGLHGAAAMDPAALDCDYLINIDLEEENEVCYSCAGNLRGTFKKQYTTHDVAADQTVFHLYVSNLLGGHSGMDIHKNRLSAGVALATLIRAAQDAGIKTRLVEVKSGVAMNAITQSGSATFVVDNADIAAMNEAFAKAQAALAEKFPLENMTVEVTEKAAEGVKMMCSKCSAELIELVLQLPQGVLAMSQKIEGLVQTSSNVGVFQLANGAAEIGTSSRSCVTADVDAIEADSRALCEKYGYDYTVNSKYPGWDGDPNTPLLGLTADAYRAQGVEARLVAIHAGLEPSWFSFKREGMQMVCLGPTLHGAHSPEETLFLDTLPPTLDVVVYILQKINTL